MHPLHAILLGALEGLTEFLPVSSTGHLILASWALGLGGEAVKTFEIVIQAGALGAVLGLYRARCVAMWQGVLGRDAAGRRLFVNILIGFLPAAVAGLLLHRVVKEMLFGARPVIAALAAGGVAMILVDRWSLPRSSRAKTLESIGIGEALLIGMAQCLALWPGTSRSMATIVAGLLLGWPATVAAEFSFLLALPTLGAATLFDLMKGGHALLHDVGMLSLGCGVVTAAIVAALAIRGFVRYVTRHGLALFGWYRLVLAAAVWVVARQ